MESNASLLARLDAAFKGITEISTFGDSILQPVKFNRFVRQMEFNTTVIPQARFMQMDAQKVDIDRTGFTGRILKSGRSAKDGGGSVVEIGSSDYSAPATYTNQLDARELQAVTALRDDALRRNIERGNFENTLIDLFGAAAGRDLEEFGLLADSNLSFGQDDVLSQTDGWCRKAEQKLYGVGSDKDFDPSANSYPENMFDAMLDALPKQFFGDPSSWVIYCTWDVQDAYRDLLRSRGTNLGDAAQMGNIPLTYKGVKIQYVPLLERAAAVRDADPDSDLIEGTIALLSNPDNMVWGVFYKVTVEAQRQAVARRTDFVLVFEGDVHYEDENAAVVALIQKENPA